MNPKLRWTLIIILAGVFVVSAIMLIRVFMEYRYGDNIYAQAQKQFLFIDLSAEGNASSTDSHNSEPDRPLIHSADEIYVDFTELKKVNSDIIGWFIVENTTISYPLLQGPDNDKYLATTYNGMHSKFGSIFMDYRNRPDLSSRHSIIYGHNMGNGAMFGALIKYTQQDYYEQRKYFHILTETGLLKYEIFSAYTADVNIHQAVYQLQFSSDENYQGFLSSITGWSQINTGISPNVNDTIVTLSTCPNITDKSKRIVIHGRLVNNNRMEQPVDPALDLEGEPLDPTVIPDSIPSIHMTSPTESTQIDSLPRNASDGPAIESTATEF